MSGKKRSLLAVLLGVVVFGLTVAAAASLGGITTDNLGADEAVVASCDTDGVTVTYTSSYDATDARYEVTAANVSGIAAACSGETMRVTLADAANASLGEATVAIGGTSATATFGTPLAAESVELVAIVISG